MVRRRARGMTLIEVMVALLVATVGLLGALAMLGTLIGGSSFSRSATEASVLTQSKIEELNAMAVTLTTPADGASSTETIDALARAAAAGPYTRTWTWSTTDGRRVALVTTSWSDAIGGNHSVSARVSRVVP
jgi:prepilin-type N-terminal cleavage/methylation domain-containing protein